LLKILFPFIVIPMIAVTGATGHLGNALIRHFSQSNETIRAVVRKTSDVSFLKEFKPDFKEGNLRDVQSLIRAFTGARIVYHSAASISILPGQYANLSKDNIQGTENVITACLETGVDRLVFISSIEAIDWTSRKNEVNENSGFHPENCVSDYGKTKSESSLLVLSAVEDGLDAVITAPTAFIGPYDYRISLMGSLILDFVRGKLPGYVDGGFDFVDVRDAAAGTIAAGEKGRKGETYILGGEYCTVPEILTFLEEITGKRKPGIKFPLGLAFLAAKMTAKSSEKKKKSPKFTVDSLNILKAGPRINCEKAKKELDYSPRKIKESLQDAIAWFTEKGFLDEDSRNRGR